MSYREIKPARSISGTVAVPGDKSISHRYAILAALAEGRSEIENYSAAADCQSTLGCLKRLGVRIEKIEKTAERPDDARDDTAGDTPHETAQKRTDGRGANAIAIRGAGLDGWRKPRRALDAGNSGTTTRLLAGTLAGQRFDSTLTGDASLLRRPMRRVIEPLGKMGARVEAREGNFAPLTIRGSALRGIRYTLPVASAQVKSAVLLAGLFAEGETSVEEPVRTRDHTELALAEFGVEVRHAGRTVSVSGHPRLAARRLRVPGDLSSAMFFIAAALLLPDSTLLAHDTGLNPTRAAVLDVLADWGAAVRILSLRSESGELTGDISVRHATLRGGEISGERVAQVIDELPALAVLGPYTERGVEIRDAAELRVKESDRIAVLAENLQRMGAQVEERPDGLRVEGRSAGRLHGAEIDPHGDHRIAMAFAVAALGAEGATRIRDAGCAGVSYPGFFDVLDGLVER